MTEDVLSRLRNMDVKMLLPREEVSADKAAIADYINKKTVLVTGGGGSIGSELCRQLAEFSPEHLIILDSYENNAFEIEYELSTFYPDIKKSIVITNVREKALMEEVFKKYKPKVVFHAAAHKHVPLMEKNVGEAVKNNILGTLTVAECADKFSAEKFILISTDKAVNPSSVMGATKFICEMIIRGINEKSKTAFTAVRFGNVMGSNGSVIPLFKRQIEDGGPVKVTHEEATRFFMTISEAAELVLQAGAFTGGGEIFMLDMGEPVNIYELATRMIEMAGLVPKKDIDIEITGLRDGEKLHEERLLSEEGIEATKNRKIYVARAGHSDYAELKRSIEALLKMVESKADSKEIKKKIVEITERGK